MTQRQFHFISGLPRSGSTLLSALLRQNPRFHAHVSSPVSGLVSTNLEALSPGSEAYALTTEDQRAEILRSLFKAYYASMEPARQVIFDTNRRWCGRMPLLARLFPQAKVIACVRDVAWIMDSLERLVRNQPFHNTRLFSTESERATVYSRVESLGRHDRLVGLGWASLKEAFHGEQGGNLLVVEYEHLSRAPEQVLRLIYSFVGEPWWDGHDFDNVTFDAPDVDQALLGLADLHAIRPKVAFEPRRTILPPDVFKKFEGMEFWRDQVGSTANVITVNRNDETGGTGPR